MRYLALLAVLVLVTGCAGTADGARTATPPADDVGSVASDSPALGLVGLWRLSGVEGEAPETWLRIEAGELTVIRPCGQESASWRASESRFLAFLYARGSSCTVHERPGGVAWLESVTDFRAAAGGWELVDGDGNLVAGLAVDGAPPASPDLSDRYREAPEVTDEVRARLRLPAPLPVASIAADSDDLRGRWIPADYRGKRDPHVEFDDDLWSGSDGCNGGMGRWIVDEGGALLAAAGVTSLMACEGWDVPGLIVTAARAAIDGDELVLFDPDGVETGRLIRD